MHATMKKARISEILDDKCRENIDMQVNKHKFNSFITMPAVYPFNFNIIKNNN